MQGFQQLTADKKILKDSESGAFCYKVNERLSKFVEHFVKGLEARLNVYSLTVEREVKWDHILRWNDISNTLKNKIRQGTGGGIAGLLLGLKTGYALKSHEKAISLLDLVSLAKENNAYLKEMLVEAGVDIFQSFEMQFMRVTSSNGEQKAICKLAEDAVDRVMNYYQKQTNGLIVNGVILGKSKGIDVEYQYESFHDKWNTAWLI